MTDICESCKTEASSVCCALAFYAEEKLHSTLYLNDILARSIDLRADLANLADAIQDMPYGRSVTGMRIVLERIKTHAECALDTLTKETEND